MFSLVGPFYYNKGAMYWIHILDYCHGSAIDSRCCITVSVMSPETHDPMTVPLICWYICLLNWKYIVIG